MVVRLGLWGGGARDVLSLLMGGIASGLEAGAWGGVARGLTLVEHGWMDGGEVWILESR